MKLNYQQKPLLSSCGNYSTETVFLNFEVLIKMNKIQLIRPNLIDYYDSSNGLILRGRSWIQLFLRVNYIKGEIMVSRQFWGC